MRRIARFSSSTGGSEVSTLSLYGGMNPILESDIAPTDSAIANNEPITGDRLDVNMICSFSVLPPERDNKT